MILRSTPLHAVLYVCIALLAGCSGYATPSLLQPSSFAGASQASKHGKFTFFKAPEDDGALSNLVLGPDGNFWYSRPGRQKQGKLVWFSPQGKSGSFTIPKNRLVAQIQPNGVAVGADGNIWFGSSSCTIGSVTPSGAFSEHVLQKDGGCTLTVGIATSDTGTWFTWRDAMGQTDYIGYITTDGQVTTYPTGTGGATLGNVVLGPDGNFWFAEGAYGVGRVTVDGVVNTFSTPLPVVTDLVVASDGSLWFDGVGSSQLVGVMDVTGQVLGTYDVGGTTYYIAPAAGGNVWVAVGTTNPQVVMAIVSRSILKSFFSKGQRATAAGPALGPDSNVWFNTFALDGKKDSKGMGTLAVSSK